MPFTFSHIALAIPLKRISNKLSTTGLVIGSMLPDVEYYLRMKMYGTWGNTLKGILLYEIPLGIILAILFHTIVRRTLILHLPIFISNHWQDFINYDWIQKFKSNWGWFIFSLVLGILTHLFWDALTHEPNYILGFEMSLLNKEFGSRPLYETNQILFSIIGLVLLVYMIFNRKILSSSDEHQLEVKSKFKFWVSVICLFLMICSIKYLFGIPEDKYYLQLLVISCSASMIAIFISSFLFRKQTH